MRYDRERRVLRLIDRVRGQRLALKARLDRALLRYDGRPSVDELELRGRLIWLAQRTTRLALELA